MDRAVAEKYSALTLGWHTALYVRVYRSGREAPPYGEKEDEDEQLALGGASRQM